MPGIAEHRNGLIDNETTSLGVMTSSVKGFWSNQRDDVSFTQLQKFWSELSPQARQKLLKVDKQTLFEQARKNMYCSRCNGLLLEGFLQIVMYSKSLQQEGSSIQHQCNGQKIFKHQNDNNSCVENGCQNVHDPSVHPWGGLTATRDGMLTLLDCYLFSNSLKGLQNVFDCARARERERELLYPDACGGGGRGWISQGMVGYGRGHGTRETCALHTARLSVDTLVDFWSALGEETRQSLLRMKEEDFIERLMYRFDSKRFCRDCRRNVIREFKELKELKRMRKEPHCTSWFCVADTPFQCEVSQDTVQANWNRTFVDTFGVYHHFEWAIGTGEGKSDILDFENVGLNGKVKVTGLDLSGLNACYITLRAWKVDGRCTELLVKAHALKGQHCVHCRLGVGDGFVTITRGLSIGSFFEHAEEIEEEEDDDSIDKDGNDLDGECSRPQKHAKSPELAREFLLDAATVIFKEQVEKAFREGTARQNAHSIFVCLALKLLEERVHVSCKEIITLEKQIKLLEEEENEKREEEERKERKRNKEREKKLRRKERFREKDKDKKCTESNQQSLASDVSKVESTPIVDEESNYKCEEDVHEACDDSTPSSPDIEEEQLLDEYTYSNMQEHSDDSPDSGYAYMKDGHGSVSTDKLQFSSRKSKFQKDFYQEPNMKWTDKRHLDFASETGNRMGKHEHRHHVDSFEASRCANGSKLSEKFPSSNSMTSDRHDSYTRSYNQQSEYRIKHHTSSAQVQEGKYASKLDSAADMPKPCYRGHRNNYVQHARDSFGRQKSRSISSHNPLNRGSTGTQRVWEPMESHKKYPRSNSDSDFTLKSSFKDKMIECDDHKPSSTSNSDDSSENSEGRGSSPHNQFEVSSCRGTSDVESPIIGKEEQHDQNQMQDIGDAQSQISVPPSHNQSLHFPIFQPPIVGFYHQSPISWPTTPANGFLSLPHPNHYVYPSPFSFGLSRNTQVMQYGLLQHPPVLNHGPLPVFQHVCQTNKINSTENQKMDNPGGVKEPHCNDANLPHVISSSDHPKGAADTENGESGNPSDPSAENTGFSLFHFGGPVALSTGLKSGPVSLRGGATSNVTPCADLGEGGHASNVNHCGEEYNLFAASNGIKFSLF